MGTASGELDNGSFGPGGQASCWQTNQQPVHPFNRNHQRESSSFSQDEESVQSSHQKVNEKVFRVKGDSLPLEQDSREDRNHIRSESEIYQVRASVDPYYANNTSSVSPAASPTNTGRQQSAEREDSAILHHDDTAPPSPRNNPFESRAARVARLKHVRPKVTHQSNDGAPKATTNTARDDESDALSHSSSDIKKRLENSPLHKMMQQKRPQRTISASPPRSREISHAGQEKPERMSEKLKRIARSQSPAPLRVSGPYKVELRDGSSEERKASANETAHPVFGYTKNTVKSGRNYRIDVLDASKTNSPPRVQLREQAMHQHNDTNVRTSQSPPRIQNSAVPMHQEIKRLDVEKNSHQQKRSTSPKQVAGRFHEHTTNRGKIQNHEYHMVDLPRNALVREGKSEYLDPTLLEVAMSDESTISTISHKYSAEADRREISGYQAPEGSRPKQIQEQSNIQRFDVDPSRSGHVYDDLQRTRDRGNNQASRYQTVKGSSGRQNDAYNNQRHQVLRDHVMARADDDIFEGLEDETLLNDTIFRFADDDDGYVQKDQPIGRHDNHATKERTRAPSSYVSRGGIHGRSGMVVEKTRGTKSVISDITSDLKSRKNREYRRKDYSGAEVATIDEKTDVDGESDVDETDIGGSRTVDDTVGYTVGEETEYQDSYEDESVIGISTQECTRELIMDSAFYKMGCAVVSSLSSVLPGQDVINQFCQDPRSCSQMRAGKNGNCNFLKGDNGISGGNTRAQEKTLQQVVQGLAKSSDSSDTDPVTRRARQDEERMQAQSKLLDYASQAMGRLSSTRRRQPQVLAPILSQTSQSGHGGTGTAFSVSDEKTHSDNSSVLSVVQTKALTEVSASLRNEGVKCLKLNRHKKWQVRYLKVSQDGNTKCPKALLWLKNLSAPTTKLPDLKTNGQGGFLFSKLTNIETMQNTSLLDNLPRNLRKDFPSLQVVALDYDCDEGPRQVIISFKNSTEAEAFRSAVKVIKLWAQREGSSSLVASQNNKDPTSN